MKKLLILVSLALVQFGCGGQANDLPPAAGTDKPAAVSGPTGRIRGTVHLQGEAPPQSYEPISENKNVCGDRVAVSRLSLGKDKGVQHAFIYLDGVPSSEPVKPRGSLLVDQKNC